MKSQRISGNVLIQKLRFENEKLDFDILEYIVNLAIVCLLKLTHCLTWKTNSFKDAVVNSDDSVEIKTLKFSN